MIPEYEAYKEYLGASFKINDWQAVDIVMGISIAHKLRGEMLWLRVIGASGSGKTEILRSILEQPGYSESLESLTPSAIKRGLALIKNKGKAKGEDDRYEQIKTQPYLLEVLDNKLVITKELAPLLTSQHDSKLSIFGLLRSVHDGELVADYGSLQGRIKQKCWFDWILGTTTYVDSENQLEMQLGSRFMDLRWNAPTERLETIHKAIDNVEGIAKIRENLVGLVSKIIAHSQVDAAKKFKVEDWILHLANIVAHFRTPVSRDRIDKKVILDQPSIEAGTRIGQNFAKIAKGLLMLGIEDVRPHLIRLAWDALPPNRACVLRAVLELESKGEEVSDRAIEKCNHSGLSDTAVFFIRKDLELLKIGSLPWREHLGGAYAF